MLLCFGLEKQKHWIHWTRVRWRIVVITFVWDIILVCPIDTFWTIGEFLIPTTFIDLVVCRLIFQTWREKKKHTIKKFKSERCQKLGNCFWIHTKTTEWSYVNRTSWVERLRTFIQHIDCIEHRCLPNRWNEVDDSFQSGCFYGFRCWWRKSSRWLRSWKINDKFRVIFRRWNNSTRNSSLAPQRSSDQDV